MGTRLIAALSKMRFCVLLSIVIVSIFHLLTVSSSASVMDVPVGRQSFVYDSVPSPLASSDPAEARPIGISEGNHRLRLLMGLAQFSSPVDIYFGVYASVVDQNNTYLLRPDGSFQTMSQGLVPWKKARIEAIDEDLFGEINIAQLLPGRYTLYVAVTPPDSQDDFVIWETSFDLPQTAVSRAMASLRAVDGCDMVMKSLKEGAIREMEATVDKLMASVLQNGCYILYPFSTDFSAGSGTPPSASQYSETNVQVAGVDEADFVKNDGKYIYIVTDKRLQIIDAWPPQQAHTISSSIVEGEPKKLFVANDRALVYSSLDPVPNNSPYAGMNYFYFPNEQECTYGYDCDFTGDSRKLKITIFDISDRSNPKVERELLFNGSYINSRRIGNAIHTVVLFPPLSIENISYMPAFPSSFCWSSTKDQIVTAFNALKEKNRQIIENAPITGPLPSITDVISSVSPPAGGEDLMQGCPNFFESTVPNGQAPVTVLSLSLDRPDRPWTNTIIGRPGAVYATGSSLYIAARQQYSQGLGWYYPMTVDAPTEATTIYKFALESNPALARYTGSGVVRGRVLNQFSMDEHEGYFRIATTSGHLPDPKTHSTVSVLNEQKGELALVGQLDNIALGEDIRSARFFGNRGFLVTFKKTDPLFALDLSKPSEPAVSGELKIPGFSTYIHLMDDNHLMSIGYDAQDMGGFAWFQGIMLQIFDVSDMAAPTLMHKEVIGTRGTTSDAATNHLAFNYFAPKGLLAIPATVCDGGNGGNYSYNMTFSGLLVYDATVENGFSRRGGISHVDPSSANSSRMCNNWWTTSNSVVKRSIFMDDFVYSISLDRIKIDPLNNLGHDLSVIDLTK